MFKKSIILISSLLFSSAAFAAYLPLTVTDGTHSVSQTSKATMGNGFVVSGSGGNAVVNAAVSDLTKTTAYTILSTDMNGSIVLGTCASACTLTLPIESSSIFAPGMSLAISNGGTSDWTVTNSTGLTITGLNSTTLKPGFAGLFISNANATDLNFFAGLQLPSSTVLGGVISSTLATHNFATGISSSTGALAGAQPAFTDLSGNIAISQINSGSGASSSTFLRGDNTWATPAGAGNVSTSGSPASGNLSKFASSTTITNGDLSGDIATSGTLATTLATVNSNTGSFGSSTAIPNFTVNGKGLMTAAGTNAVIAPAGTVTGTTLASNVVTSSLTSVGALASGSLTTGFTAINPAQGGTGLATLTAHGVLLGEGTSNVAFATIGTSGRMFLDQGAGADPSFNTMSGDCTLTNTGVITCTKTSGTNFGTAATAATGTSGHTLPYLDALNVWSGSQRVTLQTITISTATFTPNFDTGADFSATLVHASCPCTLANPSTTPVAGQHGIIYITQSSTGSDAITTWGSQYYIAGGTSAIALSTAANAIDVFSYTVKDATHIILSGPVLNVTH